MWGCALFRTLPCDSAPHQPLASSIKALMRSPLLACWSRARVRWRCGQRPRLGGVRARLPCPPAHRLRPEDQGGERCERLPPGPTGFCRKGTAGRSSGSWSNADMATTGKAGRHSRRTAINSRPRDDRHHEVGQDRVEQLGLVPFDHLKGLLAVAASITEAPSSFSIRRRARRTKTSSSTRSRPRRRDWQSVV